MTGDNADCPEWWQPQAGKHCGQLCVDIACPVCGEFMPQLGEHIVLGTE